MAWDDVARTAYGADKATTLAKTQHLEERDQLLFPHPFDLYFAEATRSTASEATMVTLSLWVPAHAVSMVLTATIQAKVDTGTGIVALRDDTDSVQGSNVNVTATSYTDTTISVTIGASNARAEHSILIKGTAPAGGTVYVANADGITWRWVYA